MWATGSHGQIGHGAQAGAGAYVPETQLLADLTVFYPSTQPLGFLGWTNLV